MATDRPSVSPTVLVVDDDHDISGLVDAILTDTGYHVALLHHLAPDLIIATVQQLRPACLLLDSRTHPEYGTPWEQAARLTTTALAVPVVLFTVRGAETAEAQAQLSPRSQAAHFTDVLEKPFELEDLLDVVARAVGQAVPLVQPLPAPTTRTQALRDRLAAGGAREIRCAFQWDWATFRSPSDQLVQLYWWQHRAAYLCAVYDEVNGTIQPRGSFPDLDLALAVALAQP
jgi:FixJ family two-component response regulator